MKTMTKSDAAKFQPYTTRPSKLWQRGEAAGAVELNDSIPVEAEVVGYAHPLKRGFRVEWV